MLRALLCALCVSAASIHAQTVGALYRPADLDDARRVYTPTVTALWNQDFLSQLTAAERSRAGMVSLVLPLRGSRQHPLEFYSDPSTRQVFLPISSIKFLDDIALAYSYYEARGCGQSAVSIYIGALRYQPSPGPASPLQTLGIPASATSNASVNEPALKILKSAVYFLAAHEFAHVMYSHRGYAAISAADAQRQEEQADAFALEVMRRIGVVPIGAAYYFIALSRLESSPGDFPSPAAYERHMHDAATHPVSTSRIAAIASGVDRDLLSFIRLERNRAAAEVVARQTVTTLRDIAGFLGNPQNRAELERDARRVNMAAFRECQ